MTSLMVTLLMACGPAATSAQQAPVSHQSAGTFQDSAGDTAARTDSPAPEGAPATSAPDASEQATSSLPAYTSEQFLQDLRAGKITSVKLSSSGNASVMVSDRPGPEAVALPPDAETLTLLRGAGIPLTVSSSRSSLAWLGQILPIAVTLLILLVMWRTIRTQQSGAAASAFGKSKVTAIAPEKVGVTFADVAGCEEAKADLQ
ncbi:MAG: cell division protein FtsH, partial [Deinococcus sp.]|nr:cell division protein FtsH [Deinococcus sp.]